MRKQEFHTSIPKNCTEIYDNFNNIDDKNNLQLNDLNVKTDHRSTLTLGKTRIESKSSAEHTNIFKQRKEYKLARNTKSINVEENYRKTSNLYKITDFVCYNVNVETTKDEENEEKSEISEAKLSKFQSLRARLKRKKTKTTNDIQNDELVQFESIPKETPADEDIKEHKEVLDNHLKDNDSNDDDVNEKGEKSVPRTSGYRLLHSRLRPDTSQTSNLVIPNLKYTLSSDVPTKAIYPENDPAPVFKPYGTFKSILPKTSSSGFIVKDQAELEDTKTVNSSELIRDLPEQSKLIKSRENTRYDILFGNLNNYDSNAVPDEEPIIVPPREPIKLIQAKYGDELDFESETDITVIEKPLPRKRPNAILVKEPSIDSDLIEDIIDDLLFEIPPSEKEEPAVEALKIEEAPVEALKIEEAPVEALEIEEAPGEIIKQEEPPVEVLKTEEPNILKEIPRKHSSIEIIPIIEILINEILKNESPIKEVGKNGSSVIPMPAEKAKVSEISEVPTELLDDSKCNKKCKYKTFCNARKAAKEIDDLLIEPNLDNEIGTKSRTSEKLVILEDCRARMGSQIPIYKGRKRYGKRIKDVEKLNVLEICECKPATCGSDISSLEFMLNNKKKDDSLVSDSSCKISDNLESECLQKCVIKNSESVEEVLQSYDFISNCGTRSYESFSSTGHDLVLNLTFINAPTQTCNSTRTDKNIQTKNLPSEKFPTVQKEKLFMYVPKNNNKAKKFIEDAKRNVLPGTNQIQWISPKLLMKNSNHSYRINPNVEIIYKNNFVAAHQHQLGVNRQFGKHPEFYMEPSNLIPTQKDCRTCFINPKDQDFAQCLKSKDRNLYIKFV